MNNPIDLWIKLSQTKFSQTKPNENENEYENEHENEHGNEHENEHENDHEIFTIAQPNLNRNLNLNLRNWVVHRTQAKRYCFISHIQSVRL